MVEDSPAKMAAGEADAVRVTTSIGAAMTGAGCAMAGAMTGAAGRAAGMRGALPPKAKTIPAWRRRPRRWVAGTVCEGAELVVGVDEVGLDEAGGDVVGEGEVDAAAGEETEGGVWLELRGREAVDAEEGFDEGFEGVGAEFELGTGGEVVGVGVTGALGGGAALAAPVTAGVDGDAEAAGDGDGEAAACAFFDVAEAAADGEDAVGQQAAGGGVGVEVGVAGEELDMRRWGGRLFGFGEGGECADEG